MPSQDPTNSGHSGAAAPTDTVTQAADDVAAWTAVLDGLNDGSIDPHQILDGEDVAHPVEHAIGVATRQLIDAERRLAAAGGA